MKAKSLVTLLLASTAGHASAAGYCHGESRSRDHAFHYKLKVVNLGVLGGRDKPVSLEIFFDGRATPPVSLREVVPGYTWRGTTSTGNSVILTYDNSDDTAYAIQHAGRITMAYCY